MNDILTGREERAKQFNSFMGEISKGSYNLGCSPGCISYVSITINMPGREKCSKFALDLFSEVLRYFILYLFTKDIKIFKKQIIYNKAGPAGFLAIKYDPVMLKKICIRVEEGHYSGRLFDIDVYNNLGKGISRSGLGIPLRTCFICKSSAKECIRKGGHQSKKLIEKIKELRNAFYQNLSNETRKFASRIEKIAYQVILKELNVTPKPGLVDLSDSGIHTDMDKNTLRKSAEVLTPYFKEFVLTGMALTLNDLNVIDQLRETGLSAEKKMFEATGGINTHKGTIFSLGLFTAATGSFYNNPFLTDKKDLPHVLSSIVARWCQGITKKDFKELDMLEDLTHGQIIYKKHGFAGARGEAERGFNIVLKYALPAYIKAKTNGLSSNDASIQALLNIIANLNDTNILYRSDIFTLKEVQRLAKEILISGGMYTDNGRNKYNWLITYFKNKGISPGGSADLLIVCFFLYEINNMKFY